jgi:hypothetical protein
MTDHNTRIFVVGEMVLKPAPWPKQSFMRRFTVSPFSTVQSPTYRSFTNSDTVTCYTCAGPGNRKGR